MHTLQQPQEGAGIRDRLTQWRLPLMLLCLGVAVLAFLWARPGGPFRSAVASSPNSTTPRTKPIEQIVPGDLVLARDPESGETRAKKVLRVFRNVSDHLRLLTVRNADGTTQVLRTTDGHPFWVPDRGWTAAAELQVGDELVHADGQPATLVATVYEAHPEGVPIFNFEVEGFHTYFVAAHGTRAPPILVHNTSPPRLPHRPPTGGEPVPEGQVVTRMAVPKKNGTPNPREFQARARDLGQEPGRPIHPDQPVGPEHGLSVEGTVGPTEGLSGQPWGATPAAINQASGGQLRVVWRPVRRPDGTLNYNHAQIEPVDPNMPAGRFQQLLLQLFEQGVWRPQGGGG